MLAMKKKHAKFDAGVKMRKARREKNNPPQP